MRDARTVYYPWSYAVLTAILVPIAIGLGVEWSWTAGAAVLAVLALPTCLAALSGHRNAAAVTLLIAACGSVLDGGAFLRGAEAQPEYGYVLLAIGVLLALSGTILHKIVPLETDLHRLRGQMTEYVHEAYKQQQQANAAAPDQAAPVAADPALPTTDAENPGQDGAVNYPMLLLTLQDVGRRISSHLDIDTLVPTVISTAKHLLKCDHCQVYFWNSQLGTLKHAGPLPPRREQNYSPHPQRGVARWVLENRQIIMREDVQRDYTLQGLMDEESYIPDAIAPLAIGGELLGLVVLDGVEQNTPSFSRLLYLLTDISALALKNAQLFKRIESMARRDGLTGLLNHASFQETLQVNLAAAQVEMRPLSVIVIDVDHFKKFNDTYGHQAGDHVLRETARLWQAVMPDYAIVARYGGEEFICALPDDDLSRASELAELLRRKREAFPLFFDGQELRVTASFGVAELGRHAHRSEDLIRSADEAMYRAKKQGRNRVCSSHGFPVPAGNETAQIPGTDTMTLGAATRLIAEPGR